MNKKNYLLSLFASLLMFSSFSITAEDMKSSESNVVPTEQVSAKWQEHKTRFTYSSFYTYYSCDGIESSVERILEELGAKDVKARAGGCGLNNVERHMTVRVKFKTLSTDPSVEGELVKANLEGVEFRNRGLRRNAVNDCDLLFDIQNQLLENFEHEQVKKQRTCASGSSSSLDVNWKLKVLKPAT